MMCDHAPDRVLLLSAGLFGAPAGAAERDREPRAAQERDRRAPDANERDG